MEKYEVGYVNEGSEKYKVVKKSAGLGGKPGYCIYRLDEYGEWHWFSDGWKTFGGAKAFCISRSHAFVFEKSRNEKVA